MVKEFCIPAQGVSKGRSLYECQECQILVYAAAEKPLPPCPQCLATNYKEVRVSNALKEFAEKSIIESMLCA